MNKRKRDIIGKVAKKNLPTGKAARKNNCSCLWYKLHMEKSQLVTKVGSVTTPY